MDSSLAHIISQTRQNVEFLIAQRHISPDNGRLILAKLPNGPDRSMAALEQQTQNLILTPPQSGSRRGPTVQAKAIWGYNEEEENSNDLTFLAGDTIEIVEETNADWWTGRHNGKQGLFPSNYVEKLRARTPERPYPPRDSYSNNSPMPSFPNQPGAYQPPPGPYPGPGYQPPPGYQPAYQLPPGGPPQMGPQYNSYGPPPVPPPVAAPPPQQPAKQSKFGNLGNTLAQSAVGGLGFGAGSAIGGDIVHSIF
ncbi:SH3 domain-containing protein [Mycena galericulata]|nr:SH3 domain-containing protein [Mycena galericulata]